MSSPGESPAPVVVRRATHADASAIAAVWQAAWHDGHDGHVPEALQAVRTEESFRVRAADRVLRSAVAVTSGRGGEAVVGFATVEDDEVEQLFVDRDHRGGGAADALLDWAQQRIRGTGHPAAWLAVVEGNARARRFYERHGFRDDGGLGYAADGPDGPIEVPTRRYVRRLDRPVLAEAHALERHPEGGWYRQTWAAPVSVDLPDLRVRPTATLILFLLPAGDASAWHRVASDEVWLFHTGAVTLELGGSADEPRQTGETRVLDAGSPQLVVAGGVWQRTVPAAHDALVSCVVSPGFDFADMQLGPTS